MDEPRAKEMRLLLLLLLLEEVVLRGSLRTGDDEGRRAVLDEVK